MEAEGYSAVASSEPVAQADAPVSPAVGVEMTSLSGPTSERLSITNTPGQGPPTAPKSVEEPKMTLSQQHWAKAKAFVEAICEHPAFILLMALYTIWALYNDDIRLSASDKDADEAYEVVISVGFFLFLFEIFGTSFYKPDYINLPNLKRDDDESLYQYVLRVCQFGSFYFWLDWIATLSLILEVSISFLHEFCVHADLRFNGFWVLRLTQSTEEAMSRPLRLVMHLEQVPERVESFVWCEWFVWFV